jgi:hypothetical protein
MFMSPFKPDPEHKGGGIRDMLTVFRQPQPHKWAFILASIAIPAAGIIGFAIQYDKEAEYRPPTVIYVKDWPANRTEAQVKAQQALDAKSDQEYREAVDAAKAAEAARRQQFRDIANELGIDVDKK